MGFIIKYANTLSFNSPVFRMAPLKSKRYPVLYSPEIVYCQGESKSRRGDLGFLTASEADFNLILVLILPLLPEYLKLPFFFLTF